MSIFTSCPQILAGQERYTVGTFIKNYHVFRSSEVGTAFKRIPDNIILPTGSVIHLMDNFKNITAGLPITDIPDLEIPLISNDTYRKYIYHQSVPDTESTIVLPKDYVFRTQGLAKHLMEFRREYGRRGYMFSQTLEMLNAPGSILPIINHNPLFRMFVRGSLPYYRAFRAVFASILNNCLSFDMKHNYIVVPLVGKIYSRSQFRPAESKISAGTLFDKTSYQYLFFIELFNFISATAKVPDNLYKQIPEDQLSRINFVFTYNKNMLFWNLADMKQLNEKNVIYSRLINHFNAFVLRGIAEDKEAEILLQDQYKDDTSTVSEDISLANDIETAYTKLTGETVTEAPAGSDLSHTEDTTDEEKDLKSLMSTIDGATIHGAEYTSEDLPEDDESQSEIANAIIDDDDDPKSLTQTAQDPTPSAKPIAQAMAVPQGAKVHHYRGEQVYTAANLDDITLPVKEQTLATSPEDMHALGTDFVKDLDARIFAKIEDDDNLTKPQKQRAQRLAQNYKQVTLHGKTLQDILTGYHDPAATPSEVTALEGKLPDTSMLKSSLIEMDAVYRDHLFEQQLVSTLVSLNAQGMFLQEINEEYTSNELNQVKTYSVRYISSQGKQTTIKFTYPVIKDDGTTYINGIKGYLKKQMCNVPICKVSATRVSLASSYNKTIVEKKEAVAHAYLPYINKLISQIQEQYPKDVDFTYTLGTAVFEKTAPLPDEFVQLASTYAFIRVKHQSTGSYSEFFFCDKNKRKESITYPKAYPIDFQYVDKIEKEKRWIFIGQMYSGTSQYTNAYYFFDLGSKLHVIPKTATADKPFHVQTSFTDVLLKAYLFTGKYKFLSEWTDIKILDRKFPVGFLLCYRYGLLATLKMLGIKYTFSEKHTASLAELQQYTSPVIVPFKDKQLVFSRYPLKASLILTGLIMFDTKAYPVEDYEYKDVYYQLLLDKKSSGFKTSYLKGIDDTFDLFIDGDTFMQLKQMNEPTEFGRLLIRATEMLTVPWYKEAASVSNHRVRSYGRMNNILYNELARAYANYTRQRGSGAVYSINPNAVIGRIVQDQSMQNFEEINPLHDIKMMTGITFVGSGGRTQESFVTADRRFPEDGVGFFSESVPDSGNVGIVAQCAIDPRIENAFGMIGPEKSYDQIAPTNTLSVTGLLMPGVTQDDGKRASFCSAQQSHTVPTKMSETQRVRTGFEKVIAHRCNDLFAYTAKQDGIVEDVNDSLKTCRIKYKDGTVRVFSYAETYGICPDIVTTQKQYLNVKKGEKFKTGDVLRYNPQFFEADPDIPKQVTYKNGVTATVALVDNALTFEDSSAITTRLAEKLEFEPVVVRVVTIPTQSDIVDYKNVGDEVEVTDPLMVFEPIAQADVTQMSVDEESMRYLEKLNRTSPKSRHSGTIVAIKAYYSVPLSELPHSLANMIRKVTKDQQAVAKYAQGTKDSIEYPESKPLPAGTHFKGVLLDAHSVIFQYYIQEVMPQSVGSKIVIDSSLKTVCSTVREELGVTKETNEQIDVLFSASSVSNRIIVSPLITGIGERVLEKMENDIVNMYFD